MKRTSIRLLCIFLCILFINVPDVSAHANLVRSEPAANSVQKIPPVQVRLWFSEEIEPGFSGATIIDKAGTTVDKSDAHRMSDDTKRMEVSLNPLSDGLYTVIWKTTSAIDGHEASGSFTFTVGDVSLAETLPREIISLVDIALNAETLPSLYEVVVRWLNLLLLILLVGALAFPMFVLFPALLAFEKQLSIARAYREYWLGAHIETTIPFAEGLRRWLGFTRLVFLLFVVMTILVLITRAFTLGGVGSIPRVLTTTRFGITWLVSASILLALGIMLFHVRWKWSLGLGMDFGLIATISLGVILVIIQSMNSHNAAIDNPPLLPLFTDVVHLLGVAVWVGGLVQLLVVLPAITKLEPRLLPNAISAFSFVAFVLVGLVTISGAYSMYLQVGSLGAFFATLYGASLFTKFLLILLLLMVAAFNLIVIRPLSARIPNLFLKFDFTIALEVILAITVLLVVGFLTSLAPARNVYNPAPSLLIQTHRTENSIVTIGIAPGSVGANDFDLKVQDANGQPISDATVVRLLGESKTMAMGVQEIAATNQGNGHYTLHSNLFSMAGTWEIQALVRRPGMDDVRTTFLFSVSSKYLERPSLETVLFRNRNALLGFTLTVLALVAGIVSTLFVQERKIRWWALYGTIIIALIGLLVIHF